MDGLVGASSQTINGVFHSSPLYAQEPDIAFGSSSLKHGRSDGGPQEQEWGLLKMARSKAAAPSPLGSNSHSLFSAGGEQMLSFSSSSSRADAAMDGVWARVRGPFTPSQWVELEHQALIYKYIAANVPIPSTLLVSIRRSLSPFGFLPFTAGSYASNTLGWGPLHLGYSGNGDPEPGRCRRTDGKKWRCSRDAVADQKYCERHINRGRHRSRKHVEGRSGHAAKVVSGITQSVSSVSGSGSSCSLTVIQQKTKSHENLNRLSVSKENASNDVQNCQQFPIQKPEKNIAFDRTSARADLLMNCPRSPFPENISFASTAKLNEHSRPTSIRDFFDDWPKNHSSSSSVIWPEVEGMQADGTQLSISIPMASSDLSSSSSSPLKSSREFDVADTERLSEVGRGRASWMPISWEASIGGPLGEVLTDTSNTLKDQSKNWALSSPTRVLQTTNNFGSVPSSTGSSPRPENNDPRSIGILYNGLLGSAVMKPQTVPLL